MRVEDIRNQLKTQYKNNEFVTDKTGGKVVEIINANFEANKDHILREVNEQYATAEMFWYLSESLDVADIGLFNNGVVPQIWQQVASKTGKINSNYGWCVFSKQNGRQFEMAVTELIANEFTRRAIMIYTRPTMHVDCCVNGMSDFMCTNTVQLLLRDGVLHYIVNQRSMDAVFGYNNDNYFHKYVAEAVEHQLLPFYKVNSYKIHFNVGSMHVYERHFKYLQ
jgi:thymidylate synthase